MPLATQVKLLRVLESGDFMRVGGTQMQTVDVRVIAATNKDLQQAVNSNDFREDLYYRLNAIPIKLAPLRERREDIHLIVRKIASEFARDNHIDFAGFTDGGFRALENYHWPGNVRELKNTVESMIVLEKGASVDEYIVAKYLKPTTEQISRNLPVPTKKSTDQVEREFIYRALIDMKDEISKLRDDIFQMMYDRNKPKSLPYFSEVVPGGLDSEYATEVSVPSPPEGKTLEEVERFMINMALEQFNGSKRKAAKSLGISERTLYRKIKEYDLPF